MGCAQSGNNAVKKGVLTIGVENLDKRNSENASKSFYDQSSLEDHWQNSTFGFGDGDDIPFQKGDSTDVGMIRQDLTQNQIPPTPKNELQMVRLTPLLLKFLETAAKDRQQKQVSAKELELSENKQKEEEMETLMDQYREMLMSNTCKVSNNLDEASYCKYMASRQVIYFQQSALFVELFIHMITYLKQVYESKLKHINYIEMEDSGKHWHTHYSQILLSQVVEFLEPLKLIKENEKLLKDYKQSEEMVALYSCLLAILRFIEGISWGYSPMLMHQALDKEAQLSLKVTVNQLILIRQNFRENSHLSEVLNSADIPSVYFPRETFQAVASREAMNDIFANRKGSTPPYINTIYLQNQAFRKTYVSIKRSIDDWLRLKNCRKIINAKDVEVPQENGGSATKKEEGNKVPTREIQSVQELMQYQLQFKAFTKTQIRAIKRPANFPVKKQKNQSSQYSYSSVNLTPDHQESTVGVEIVKNPLKVGQGEPCSYEIENSKQFLVITGDRHEELRVIVESFLQANMKIRTRYKCCALHHCTMENAYSRDSYYIVKNIMRQILHTLPILKHFLLISPNTEFKWLIQELFDFPCKDKETLRETHNPDIFVRFIKRINELKLDINIVIAVTGLEYAFDANNLQNFVYLLRSASVYLGQNSFIKLIATMQHWDEPGPEIQKYNTEQTLNSSRAMTSLNVRSQLEFNESIQNTSNRRKDEENFPEAFLASSRLVQPRSMSQRGGQVIQNFHDFLAKDIPYQMQVCNQNYIRYNNVLKILQTGAVCKVESGQFFQKDGRSLFEFSMKFLYQDWFNAQEQPSAEGLEVNSDLQAKVSARLTELTDLALEKSKGRYNNLIELVSKIIQESGSKGSPQSLDDPRPIIESYLPQDEIYKKTFQKLFDRHGAAMSLVLLQFFQISHIPMPAHIAQRFLLVLNIISKRQNIARFQALQQTNDPEAHNFSSDQSFMKYYDPDFSQKSERDQLLNLLGFKSLSKLTQFEKSLVYHLEQLQAQIRGLQTRLDRVLEGFSLPKGPKPLFELQSLIELLEPTLLLPFPTSSLQDQPPKQIEKLDLNLITHILNQTNIIPEETPTFQEFTMQIANKKQSQESVLELLYDKYCVTEDPSMGLFGDQTGSIYENSLFTVLQYSSSLAIKTSVLGQNFSLISSQNIVRNHSIEMIGEIIKAEAAVQAAQTYSGQQEAISQERNKWLLYHDYDLQSLFNYQINLNKVVALSSTFAVLCGEDDAESEATLRPEEVLSFYDTFTIPFKELLRPELSYLMIKKVIGSYSRYMWNLRQLSQSFEVLRETEYNFEGPLSKYDGVSLVLEYINIICNIEQTLRSVGRSEPFTYADFLSQVRGRVLFDKCYMDTMGVSTDEQLEELLKSFESSAAGRIPYFKNFHNTLKENQRLEMSQRLPGCLVLAAKFYSKSLVFLSISNGLILAFNTANNTVEKIFANKGAIIDCLKFLNNSYLITAGIDSKVRLYNIMTEKPFAKFEIHKYATQQIILVANTLYTYGGHDMKLVKFDTSSRETDCWINLKSHITCLKLVKYRGRSPEEAQDSAQERREDTTESIALGETRIAAAFSDFDVVLYDLDLNQLIQVSLNNMTPGDEVMRVIRVSDLEIMCFSNEGAINVLQIATLDESKSGTIFSLKNEDYIDLLLIKSREFFLFTIERQKIEFYNAQSLKRTDSWDYFFQNDIACCNKNREGSKIFVGDKSGNMVLFNFMKQLDQAKEKLIPQNRRMDPVVSIEITKDERKKEDEHLIISCSQDRDLRLWSRSNGAQSRKYDLGSFLAENVQCIRLGKNEDNLFLGSKDMNVYLINILKGKLCVVYEGHWNKVTSIYSIPQTDIMVTLSESNIKVWDLEYDECIKNMNEHSSLIVYIDQDPTNEQQVLTIGEQFELKLWNYVTGDISVEYDLNLGKDRKSQRTLQIVCCDVMDEMTFVALNNGEIFVYSLSSRVPLYSFQAWQNEEVIFIQALKTESQVYLILVLRTACILYSLVSPTGPVLRQCTYQINAQKSPDFKSSQNNKYSSNCRYYFTTARLLKLNVVDSQTEDLQQLLAKISIAADAQELSKGMLVLKFLREWAQSENKEDDVSIQLESFLEQNLVKSQSGDMPAYQDPGSQASVQSPAVKKIVSRFQQNGDTKFAVANSLHEDLSYSYQESRANPGTQPKNLKIEVDLIQEAPADKIRGQASLDKSLDKGQIAGPINNQKEKLGQSKELQQKGVKHTQIKTVIQRSMMEDEQQAMKGQESVDQQIRQREVRKVMRVVLDSLDNSNSTSEQQEQFMDSVSLNLLIQILDVAPGKPKIFDMYDGYTKVLVCIGDSRGQTTMMHLHLE